MGIIVPKMGPYSGVIAMPSMTIGDALFTKTQQRVLGLLYGKPGRSFYTNEIVRRAGMGRGTICRELERMVSAGLLLSSREGNQLHYRANVDNPVYNELVSIVRKMKDQDRLLIGGTVVVSRAALQELAQRYHIRRLVLFGSAARGELKPDSDIDLLVEFENDKSPSMGGMLEIQEAFAALFGDRKVDVAMPSILNNPYRRREIEKDMEELYAA